MKWDEGRSACQREAFLHGKRFHQGNLTGSAKRGMKWPEKG